MLRCGDDSLYTGISTDVARRVREHLDGKRGARRLRGRGPLEVVFEQRIGERGLALRAEHSIKQMPKHAKERLVNTPGAMGAHLDALIEAWQSDSPDRPAIAIDSRARSG